MDFYCRKLGLVIEIDGDSHDAKQRYDARRQRTLEKLGLTILRFTDREVMKHLEGVLVEIHRTVGELELANKS